MQGLSFARYAASFGMAVLLGGCSGAGSAVPSMTGAATAVTIPSRINTATLVTLLNVRPVLPRAALDAPTIRPNCCARKKTLFVTDAFGGSSFTGTVYAFGYKTTKLLGQLPAPPDGWLQVQGACADNRGNVYFANTSLSTVEEYTHAGKYVATFNDPGQYPVGCAYDRTTEDLAVSNIIDTSGGPGSLSIYNGGVLQSTYHPQNMSRVYGIGYVDGTAILWVNGTNSSGIAQYDTFYQGIFTPFTIKGIGSQGSAGGLGMQWSAKTRTMNLLGTNASATVLYHVAASSKKVVGETVLDCNPSQYCAAVDFFIKGSRVSITDAIGLNVRQYDYPAGGLPVKSYSATYSQPIGIVVSP